MLFFLLWVFCILATTALAYQKNIGPLGFFFLALFTGPLAFIIACVTPARTLKPETEVVTQTSLQEQAADLRALLARCQRRMDKLDEALRIYNGGAASASTEAATPAAPSIAPVAVPATQPAAAYKSPSPSPRQDFELSLGKDWLNKIGIAVMALGVTFLVAYSFKYFGPWLKILTGFALGGLFFFLGHRMEFKKQLVNFGRALTGGAWAIVYLTTYAMYHFEASRVITSQTLDLFLLAVVAAGIIWHSVKYKSEALACVALGVAYFTGTIDQISWFGIASSFLLGFTGLFLVQRFAWVKTLMVSVLFTYAISFFAWPSFTPQPTDIERFTLLTGFWGIFILGVHLIKAANDSQQQRTVAAANVANIALYSILSYPLLVSLFPGKEPVIAFAEGLIYLALAFIARRFDMRLIYISDLVAGIFALTFAIYLKFMPATTLILWLIEIPFLLYIGLKFKEHVYRYMAYGLAVLAACEFFFCGWWFIVPTFFLWGFNWPWDEFVTLVGTLSMAACFIMLHRANKKQELTSFEKNTDQLFSAAAGFLFTAYLHHTVPAAWLHVALLIEACGLIVLSFALRMQRFGAYAYALLVYTSFFFVFRIDSLPAEGREWAIAIRALLPVGAYYLVRALQRTREVRWNFDPSQQLLYAGSLIVLVCGIFQHLKPEWISLVLGVIGVLLVVMGFARQEKLERTGGLVMIGITLVHVIFHDLAGLPIVLKIVTFMVLGALFIGVSYIYNRFTLKK